jgi:mannitol-1-phosphate 5-dehydrogenase
MTDAHHKHAVIIGAGKTGRGFVARLLARSGFHITFIDKSESLIHQLTTGVTYAVRYFDSAANNAKVTATAAYLPGTPEAIHSIAQASLVFTAVGENCLSFLAPDLLKAAKLRLGTVPESLPITVITCENGVSPGSVLLHAIKDAGGNSAHFVISEAAVFCSTIEADEHGLDIISEAYEQLPYDAEVLRDVPPVAGMLPVQNFRTLLQRKIFTYNCFSACIAYLGALKGLEFYADAANDDDIRFVLKQINGPLNRAICAKLNVDPEEQRKFSEQAIDKFSNPAIRDSIARNARDARRKLTANERMIGPALWVIDIGESIRPISLVVAAAMHYGTGEATEMRDQIDRLGVRAALAGICGLDVDHPLIDEAANYYEAMKELKQTEVPDYSSLFRSVAKS